MAVVDPAGGMTQGIGLFEAAAEVVVNEAGLVAQGFRAVGGAVAGAEFGNVAEGGVLGFGDLADAGEITEK